MTLNLFFPSVHPDLPKIDFRSFVSKNGQKVTLSCPESLSPTRVNEDLATLWYTEFKPFIIYGGNVDDTINGWIFLTSQKIDLHNSAKILGADELYIRLSKGYVGSRPKIVPLCELSFLFEWLRKNNVKNIEHMVPKIRKKINGVIRHVNNSIDNQKDPANPSEELIKTINSLISELKVCKNLFEKKFNVSFNQKLEGPDLYIDNIPLEITRKFDRKNLDESLTELKIDVPTLLFSLSILIKDKLKKFRQGKILVVDITGTHEGSFLFSMTTNKLVDIQSFSIVMKKAIKNSYKRKNSVIFFGSSGIHLYAFRVDLKTLLKNKKLLKRKGVWDELVEKRREFPLKTIEDLSRIKKQNLLDRVKYALESFFKRFFSLKGKKS